MAELKEVFEMVTKQTEPDQDSWKQQEHRQRRTTRNRRVGAIVLVAAMIAAAVLVVVVSRPKDTVQPGTNPSPTTVPLGTTPPIGAEIVGLDGTPIQQIPLSGGSAYALSPDGTTIAYVPGISDPATGGVKLVGIGGGNEATLVGAGNTNTGDAMNHVSWSPDGSKIAYAWDGDIYVMNADGSAKLRLTHSDPGKGRYYPVFSPDGSTIAYWHGSSTGVDEGPRDAEIFTVAARGGTPRRLTKDSTPDIEPTWSPDGTQIAFRHEGSLRIMNADGSDPHNSGSYSNGPWAPAWSPDGSTIAFLVFDKSQRAADGGPLMKLRLLTLATRTMVELPIRVETDGNGPQWTTDGSLLVNRYD